MGESCFFAVPAALSDDDELLTRLLRPMQRRGFWEDGFDGIVSSTESLHGLTATNLQQIRSECRGRDRTPTRFGYSTAPATRFDSETSAMADSHFLIGPRFARLIVTARVAEAEDIDVTEPPPEWVQKVLQRLGRRFGLRLAGIAFDDRGWGFVEAEFFLPLNYTLERAIELARLGELSIGLVRERMTAGLAFEIVRAGVPEVLIGLSEGTWLDAKRAPYRIAEEVQQLELGKDVSAFANSEGGLLAIGFIATRQSDGRETITSVSPCRLDLIRSILYSRVLERVVYPLISGLDLALVETESGQGVLGIYVPPQPRSLMPFLLSGRPSERRSRIEGNYIGLFRRRGDHTVAISTPELHAALNRHLDADHDIAVHPNDND